ncbi:GNAT family N-acetyltransferase [Streptomyces sp. NPDC002537]
MAVWRTDTVADAVRQGWDALVDPDDLFRTPGWLSLESEQTNIPPVFYLAGDEPGTPEAALPCFPLDATSEAWPFMRADLFLRQLAEQYALETDGTTEAALDGLLPTRLCGGRRVPNTRVLTAPDLPEERRPRLIDELVAAAEDDARENAAASVSFLFVAESDRDLRQTLAGRGYAEFPTARYSTLHLPAPGFDAYLGLIAANRRRKLRYERRQLADAQVTFEVEPLTPELTRQLVPLLRQHGGKYGHDYAEESLTRNLELHDRHCGDDLRVITGRSADGVVRGFSLVVRRGSRLYVRQTGYDYEWQGKLPLYFALCYYEPVEYASRIGATALDYAVASEATKLSRGCTLEQRYGYLKVFDDKARSETERLLDRIRQAAAAG